MRSSKLGHIFFTLFVLAMAACLIGPSSILAAEEEGKKDDRPPRSIAMAPEYPGVIIPPGEVRSLYRRPPPPSTRMLPSCSEAGDNGSLLGGRHLRATRLPVESTLI